MIYFVLALIAVLIIFIILGLYSAFSIAHNKKKPDVELSEYSYSWHEPDYESKIKDWIKEIDLDYFFVKSPYQYNLNCLIVKNNEDKKWVILLHGVTLNHKAMMDIAFMYTNLGFNILLWDSRNHGKSGGSNITYGYYEKYDLKEVVDYLRKNYGEKIKIGLHGVSMGSGILLSYASAVIDDCDFYIADCPYSDFKKQVFDVTKRKLKLPDKIISVIIYFSQIIIRLLFKFEIGKINIEGKIHRVDNPALFITCKDDGYINPHMSEVLYNKCGSDIKEIKLFDEGKHGGAFSKNREEYIKVVKEFLKRIGLLM